MEETDLETPWRQLLGRAAALAKEANTLKSVAKQLADAAGYEELVKVQRSLAKLDALELLPPELLEAARSCAEPVEGWLATEWGRRAGAFVDEARGYFADRGLNLDGEGTQLRVGVIEIQVDPPADRADLRYAGELLKARVPLVADRVFRAVEAARARLEKALSPPEVLADRLLAVHARLLEREGKATSTGRVSLPELHFELFIDRQSSQARRSLTKGKLKEYPRAQFAFDLARLLDTPNFLERPAGRLELLPATASEARNAQKSVVIVRADGGEEVLGRMAVG